MRDVDRREATQTTAAAAPIFADRALARRIEAAWEYVSVENAKSLLARAPASGAECLAVGGGQAAFLGPGSPLSQAQNLGMDGPVSADDLTRMEQFFRDRGSPTQLEVSSLCDTSLLPELSARGYQIAGQTHMLVLPLGERVEPSRERPAATPGVAVRELAGDAVEPWVDLVMGCFVEQPATVPETLREGAIAMALVPGTSCWEAIVDGEPAGGATLFIHRGLALFCGDGTLAAYRRRGIQSALLEARLAHAEAMGCDLAVITTDPGSGSQRNAERLGFRVVYVRTMMVRA